MLSLCVCLCGSVLFDVGQHTVSPRCSTSHHSCVLRNPPHCHPHLHASFLHLPSSEGTSVFTHNLNSGSLRVLKKTVKPICSHSSSVAASKRLFFYILSTMCECMWAYRVCACFLWLQHYVKVKHSPTCPGNMRVYGTFLSFQFHFMVHRPCEGLGWVDEAGLLCQRWFGLLSVAELQICWRPKLIALIKCGSQ